MKLAYSLCLTVSVLTLAVNNCAVASPLDTSHIHTQHTLGLKPISSLEDSYNLAAAVFLPDFEDSIGFGGNTLDDDVARRDNCAGFALASCPAHAKCSKCTFDTKYKITSCDTDYKQSGNACIAKTCSEINASYKADVPTNQICNITNTSVRTCYSSCRAVNTSGYPLDTCPSGAVCTTAPDCVTSATTKGNCSPVKQKVTGCTSSTQKVNSTATACIDKDDTCPTNYYKSCATGTQGDPKYTEKGTACYQCKPPCDLTVYKYDATNCMAPNSLEGLTCGGRYESCIKPGLILYSDRTTSYDVLPNKTAIGIVFDETNRIAAAINNIGYDAAKVEKCVNNSSSPVDEATLSCKFVYSNAVWEWGSDLKSKIDIPELENCQECEATCAPDGKENTAKILAYGKAHGITYKAAEFTNRYSPANGCASGSWCGKGNWFMPSMRDLYNFFNNKETIRRTVKKIPGAEDIVLDGYKSGYSSSNEYLPFSASTDGRVCDFMMNEKNWYEGIGWGYGIKINMATFVLPMIKY